MLNNAVNLVPVLIIQLARPCDGGGPSLQHPSAADMRSTRPSVGGGESPTPGSGSAAYFCLDDSFASIVSSSFEGVLTALMILFQLAIHSRIRNTTRVQHCATSHHSWYIYPNHPHQMFVIYVQSMHYNNPAPNGCQFLAGKISRQIG